MPRAPAPPRRLPVLAVLAGAALLLPFQMAGAQETGRENVAVRDELSGERAREIVDFLNDSSTVRVNGRSRIPASRSVVGDLGVLGGPFIVAGRIEGLLVVVNGDLELEPGAEITGEVTVVGGDVHGLDAAAVDGGVTVYVPSLRYARRDGRIAYVGTRTRSAEEEAKDRPLRRDLGFGHSHITVRAGASYNRVEGLPVIFGPVLEFRGRNRLRLEALGIWRTESGLDLRPEELGFDVRLEQLLAGPALRFGVGLRSVVSPIEDWGVSDLESSLSTFLFHEDFRDYVGREGWSVYARLAPGASPLDLSLTYRDEEHQIVQPGGPWSLVDNDDAWRAQPLVAEGSLRSLTADATVDTRNREDDPSHGWLLSGEFEVGLGGSLTERPWRSLATADGAPEVSTGPKATDTHFTRGLVDLRRYNRIGPGSRFNVRVVAGGSLTGDPLPAQFQHAFGGAGSLPGYDLFAGDCGARSRKAILPDLPGAGPFVPFYGCDRFALFQAEYRGSLGLDFQIGGDDDDEWEWYGGIDLTPSWALFFDAGRGWTRRPTGPAELAPGGDPDLAFAADTREFYDVGAGLFIGDLGLYWALPLEGGDGVNFFVRLHRRF